MINKLFIKIFGTHKSHDKTSTAEHFFSSVSPAAEHNFPHSSSSKPMDSHNLSTVRKNHEKSARLQATKKETKRRTTFEKKGNQDQRN